MWCVCHCVWFLRSNCLCVLFAVYCDVVWFVACLRVLLCVRLCVFGRFMCLCVLCETDRVMLHGVFMYVWGAVFCACCSC